MDSESIIEEPIAKRRKSFYKWCFVPLCSSTTTKNPDKIFFKMPKDPGVVKKWFSAARRADPPTLSDYYCCQDHFDLKSDMDNYLRFQIYGGNLKLRSGVLPHKFECQPDRPLQSVDLNRSAFKKINQQKDLEQVLKEHEAYKSTSTKSASVQIAPAIVQSESLPSLPNEIITENTDPKEVQIMEDQDVVGDSISNNGEDMMRIRGFGEGSLTMELIQRKCYDKNKQVSFGTQTDFQKSTRSKTHHYRSKAVMCKLEPQMKDSSIQVQVNTTDKACSPFGSMSSTSKSLEKRSDDSSVHTPSDGSKSYAPSTSCTSSPEKCKDQDRQAMKLSVMNVMRYHISRNPKKYLGISEECMPWLMSLIKKYSSCSEDEVQLTLMKIRLNDGYERLADQFAKSTSQASRIFHKVVPILSHLLKRFILQPSKHQVQRNLSIPFRAHYSNVYAIIDAFEVQIQKPTHPLHQALSWSEYKKCNTIKFIIAITPDGKIIFISKAYSGRVSDMTCFEDCGLLDILPAGSALMADRGFKNIENILRRKGCQLVRPPTVYEAKKPTKAEVLETKRIASLRIHVERLIRRVREYKILGVHSCLDINMMPLIDDIISSVCGLINLQGPLIKT